MISNIRNIWFCLCIFSWVSNRSLEEPVEDEMVCLSGLVLWDHMACPVDGGECEAVILFDIASELVVYGVFSPVCKNVSVQALDPSHCASCWHGPVCISWEFKHPVFTFQWRPESYGAGWVSCIIKVGFAQVPGLDLVGNMKSFSYIFTIKIFDDRRSPGAWWKLAKILLWAFIVRLPRNPRSVICGSIKFLVGFKLLSHNSNSPIIWSVQALEQCFRFVGGPAISKYVIYVQLLYSSRKLCEQSQAFGSRQWSITVP